MKRLFATGLLALVSILPTFNTPGEEKSDDPLANAPTQYSADLIITRKAGSPVSTRVYVDGNKQRNETDINGGTVIIQRGDLSKQYILTSSSKTYVERPLNPRRSESPAERYKRMGIAKEKTGTEEVNGERCDKYRYGSDQQTAQIPEVRMAPAMRNRRRVSGFIWVSTSTHMILKSENPGSTSEWKNIKIGPQDASLFEVPADYKKVEQNLDELKSGDASPAPSPSGEKSD
jgi:Domain of unknown function (DUF4412)